MSLIKTKSFKTCFIIPFISKTCQHQFLGYYLQFDIDNEALKKLCFKRVIIDTQVTRFIILISPIHCCVRIKGKLCCLLNDTQSEIS